MQGKFSLLQDVQDISYVLTIPLAYVIKVEADVISDELVKHCLDCLQKNNAFTVLFRMTCTKVVYIYNNYVCVCMYAYTEGSSFTVCKTIALLV